MVIKIKKNKVKVSHSTDKEVPGKIRDKKRILPGFWIKIIATMVMLIDHITASVFLFFVPLLFKRGFTLGEMENIRTFLRAIGRLSFPLFCFLIVEGFIYTKNVKKYILSMLIFAFISEVPFDMAVFGSYFNTNHQNVFFTLFFGLLALHFLKKWKKNPFFQLSAILSIATVSEVLGFDYGYRGILLIVTLYLFREKKSIKYLLSGIIVTLSYFDSILVVALTSEQSLSEMMKIYSGNVAICYSIFAMMSFFIMEMYNGEKGKNINKYIFYGFYPAHLLILGLIKIHFQI